MNSSATSISVLTGTDDTEIVARKAFLEFTKADAALWIVASGNLLTLAEQVCQVPIALISFVDENRQWFKLTIGVSA
jgi:hypothetical protein